MFDIDAEFPEAFYIPARTDLDGYLQRIRIGSEVASRSSCFITCLARDCESVINHTIARVERLASYFKQCTIHFYENDSKDATGEILKLWERKESARIYKGVFSEKLNLERGDQDYSLIRRKRMAYCRNKYMNDQILNNYDYTIVYDADILGGFSYHGVLNSLGWDGWDVIGSNSLLYRDSTEEVRRVYYDTWALRRLEDINVGPHYTQEHSELMNKLSFERGQELVRVLSCFGGLGIYKSKCLLGLKYHDYDVEHVALHNQIRLNGGKIYLNPSQICLYNNHFFAANC